MLRVQLQRPRRDLSTRDYQTRDYRMLLHSSMRRWTSSRHGEYLLVYCETKRVWKNLRTVGNRVAGNVAMVSLMKVASTSEY